MVRIQNELSITEQQAVTLPTSDGCVSASAGDIRGNLHTYFWMNPVAMQCITANTNTTCTADV